MLPNYKTRPGYLGRTARKDTVRSPIPLLPWWQLGAYIVKEDMVYLTALGQPVIVLNSLKAASELLDRRANIYSDRPRLIMGNEILSGGLFSAFLPYGDMWV